MSRHSRLRSLPWLVVAASVFVATAGFSPAAVGTTGGPCEPTGQEAIVTDKDDYAPEETVTVSGAGFAAECDVTMRVTRPNGTVVKGDGTFAPGTDTVTTDQTGAVVYEYILNGVVGEYIVEALGAGSAVLATTAFTDGTIQVRAAGPAGTTFDVDWEKYDKPGCDTGDGFRTSYGTRTSVTSTGSGGGAALPGVADGESLRLVAGEYANGSNPPAFGGWAAVPNAIGQVPPTGSVKADNPRDICLPGFTGVFARTYAANYTNAPVVSSNSAQAAEPGVEKVFDLGSFTDSTGGPWTVLVDWGHKVDGQNVTTTFGMDAPGAITPQAHTYPVPPNPLGIPLVGPVQQPYTVTVTVTDSTDLSGSAKSTINNVNPPPTAEFTNPMVLSEVGGPLLPPTTATITDVTGDLSQTVAGTMRYTSLPLSELPDLLPLVPKLQDKSATLPEILEVLGIGNTFSLLANMKTGMPAGMALDGWSCGVRDAYREACSGKLAGKANVEPGIYLIFAADRFGQLSMQDDGVLPVVVLPSASFDPAVTAAQYSDPLVSSPVATWTTGPNNGLPSVAHRYVTLDQVENLLGDLERLTRTPLSQWDLQTVIDKVAVPGVDGLMTGWTDGLPPELAMSDWACAPDGDLKKCTSRISGIDDAKAGLYLIALRDHGFPALRMLPYLVLPEDVRLDTADVSLKPADVVNLTTILSRSLLKDSTDGDLSKIWVRWQVKDCFSGSVVQSRYTRAGEFGPVSSPTLTGISEGVYCVKTDLVRGDGDGRWNEWYYALPSLSTVVLTDYQGQFMTGGGWVDDPSGGKGHFGFTTRYTKKDGPKGNLVYIWRGTVNGVTADFQIKANAISGIYFSGTTAPMSGNFTGKASLSVVKSGDGTDLPGGMGNLAFTLRVKDDGVDTFQLEVYNGKTLVKRVPVSPVRGGNIVIHNK